MFYFLIAALGLFALHHAKAPSTASSGLPWSPPVTVVPTKIKSRDTLVTDFPVDVWNWVVPASPNPFKYVLAVASDDASSFVAYMLSGPTNQKILTAKGTGPLTPQIAAQV